MTPTNELKPHRYGSRTDRLTTAGDSVNAKLSYRM
jgi:hypothetical protein